MFSLWTRELGDVLMGKGKPMMIYGDMTSVSCCSALLFPDAKH